MKKSDRGSALFFLLLSLFISQQSVGIGLGTLRKPGPGLLSFCIGSGMALLSLWLLIHSFLRREKQTDALEPLTGANKTRLFIVSLSLFVYAFAVNWLGFVLATFIFTLFLLWLMESKKWWLLITQAACIAIGNYLFFEQWLGLSLPKGFLTW